MAGSSIPAPELRADGSAPRSAALEVLFVGIIDTLVPFSGKKAAEYHAKSKLTFQQNFSVVPPEEYSARFVVSQRPYTRSSVSFICH